MAETKPPSAAVCGSSNSIYELCAAVQLFIVTDIETAPAHEPCTFLSSFRLPAPDFAPVLFAFPSFVLSLNFSSSARLMESDRKTYKGGQAGARRQRPQKLEAIEEKKGGNVHNICRESWFFLLISLCVSHGTSDAPQNVGPSLCLFHITAGSSACPASKRFMIRPRRFLRFR